MDIDPNGGLTVKGQRRVRAVGIDGIKGSITGNRGVGEGGQGKGEGEGKGEGKGERDEEGESKKGAALAGEAGAEPLRYYIDEAGVLGAMAAATDVSTGEASVRLLQVVTIQSEDGEAQGGAEGGAEGVVEGAASSVELALPPPPHSCRAVVLSSLSGDTKGEAKSKTDRKDAKQKPSSVAVWTPPLGLDGIDGTAVPVRV